MPDNNDDSAEGKNGPEYNPDNSVSGTNAPKGMINGLSTPSLGLGQNAKIVRMVVDVSVVDQDPYQEHVEPEDTRPIALKTGVEAIDAQSEEDGQRLLSMEEIKALTADQESAAPDNGPENLPHDDGTTLTPKTNDPDVNAHLEELGHNLTTSNAEMQGQEAGGDAPDVAAEFAEVSSYDTPFGSKGDLERAFNQVKGKEVARTQTKGPEPS
jgi:hypothetical protein